MCVADLSAAPHFILSISGSEITHGEAFQRRVIKNVSDVFIITILLLKVTAPSQVETISSVSLFIGEWVTSGDARPLCHGDLMVE